MPRQDRSRERIEAAVRLAVSLGAKVQRDRRAPTHYLAHPDTPDHPPFRLSTQPLADSYDGPQAIVGPTTPASKIERRILRCHRESLSRARPDAWWRVQYDFGSAAPETVTKVLLLVATAEHLSGQPATQAHRSRSVTFYLPPTAERPPLRISDHPATQDPGPRWHSNGVDIWISTNPAHPSPTLERALNQIQRWRGKLVLSARDRERVRSQYRRPANQRSARRHRPR